MAIVFDRDLRFGVGTQPGNLAGFSQPCQFAPQFVGERNRCRHQFRRFIARKAKHQTLIARALLVSAFSFGSSSIDTLLDVPRLLAHFADHPARVGVKNAIAVYVPDVANGGADLLLKIKLCIACNFASQHDEVALGESFASDAA